ncbi:MAG TPA: NAD(P)/FAD-dependent oxidoreductase [Chthoniobacteraceae bacterium]|nr:NAD(P)/FAD-dependent oxidoreductase [Chthoniobacteraceae bacterium]
MLEVVVVGGGPAGLSAALVLGRCRRKTLVLDAGHPRNAASKAMHGFLSRDGMPPAEFLDICRQQLARYNSVEFRRAKVTDVARANDAFTTTLENGETFASRMVLLATGLIDECPPLAGFEQFYGRSVHHCPYCDGWEQRDQPLAVYGAHDEAVDLAAEVRHWSKDVILCSGGKPRFSRKRRQCLERLGIVVIEDPIERLEGEGDQLRAIRFVTGKALPRTALFFSPGQFQRSPFGEKLGCKFDRDNCIRCAEGAATGIPGLYVAGNASRGLQLVIIAAGEGTEAAFAINEALIEADAGT